MKKIDLKFIVMLLSFMLFAPMFLFAQTPTDATVMLTPAGATNMPLWRTDIKNTGGLFSPSFIHLNQQSFM